MLVLPLGHPARMAEEVATLDHVSQGRFDLGIGRSGFPWAYEGYNIPYHESRERFREFFEVMQLAWTQERFSYEGKYYTFQDVCLIPKPYQQPHSSPALCLHHQRQLYHHGHLGYQSLPAWVGLPCGNSRLPLPRTWTAWREAGHPGNGDVILRVGIYVAADKARAFSEPQESTMSYYNRIRQGLLQTASAFGGDCAPSGLKAWPASHTSSRCRTAWSTGHRTPLPTVCKSYEMNWVLRVSSWNPTSAVSYPQIALRHPYASSVRKWRPNSNPELSFQVPSP